MGKCFANYLATYMTLAIRFCHEFCMDYLDDIQFVNVLTKMVSMVGMKPLSVNSRNLYTSHS